ARPGPPAAADTAHVRNAGAERDLCRSERQDPEGDGSMATNRIITIAIITILVLLILAVIFSKFR
ncbi:hypothetical protein MAPG_10812, partial [Magnaporthiopsis poae ATCC 64411]